MNVLSLPLSREVAARLAAILQVLLLFAIAVAPKVLLVFNGSNGINSRLLRGRYGMNLDIWRHESLVLELELG